MAAVCSLLFDPLRHAERPGNVDSTGDRSTDMNRLRELLTEERSQFLVFGLLSLVVSGFTGVLTVTSPQVFRPYFGAINPMLSMLGVLVLGFSLWFLLLSRGWFVVYEPGALRQSLPLVVVLPTVLAVGMVAVDVLAVLPPDTNVRFPRSLLFYPTMGFVVEILFHLLPLSIAFVTAAALSREIDRATLPSVFIVIISLLEPVFQLQAGFSSDVPRWTEAYIGLNVFAINLAQLYLFKRYDFLTMYAFRLVYYLLWHILWGVARVQILF